MNVAEIKTIIAMGRPGVVQDLPEAIREREKPAPRKPLEEIVFEGSFEGLQS